MNRLKRIILTFSLALTSSLIAQITVSGTVTDASTGKALAGANVVVEGTNKGSAADANGEFTIGNVSNGSTLTASMIGYKDMSMDVSRTVNFSLEPSMIEMSGLEVLASRADEKTPVAYTNVSKAEMEVRLGSQEIPMVLNTTPSVYATQQGGGAGDARINVRGFNQRNVAVMINGVPQNDMENGWVYWSNWDGVGDATSSIQMQRGLSAVNLATPSIGGTMNIITDPASMERGGSFKQELGAGSFLKSSFNYNTGLIADKFAFSTTLVKKTGEGIIDKTWTDAYAYYLGSSYQMNNSNRFELYAIGAPQRHGQNLYKQNMSTYSQELANDTEGFDATAFATDDTKQKHIDKYKSVLDELDELGEDFITGGDLNSLPPNAQKIDFCEIDQCEGENLDDMEGCRFNNFEGEPDLLKPLYNSYFPAIDTSLVNNHEHLTHSTWNDTYSDLEADSWDRKLDYLFTNYQNWTSTGKTDNTILKTSDHAPVTAILYFNQ